MKIDLKDYKANTLLNTKVINIIQKAWDSLGTFDQYPLYHSFGDIKEIKQFSFLVAMPTPFVPNLNKFLGYIVQNRLNQGIHNTNKILIRTFDGDLAPWENQSFLILPEKDSLILKELMKEQLDEEIAYCKDGGEYTLSGGFPASGYIVQKKQGDT
jgi:hypothetical protein